MNITKKFEKETKNIRDLGKVIQIYKDLARRPPGGYLNTPVFERMRDGKDDEMVKRFFAGPFAEVRSCLQLLLNKEQYHA